MVHEIFRILHLLPHGGVELTSELLRSHTHWITTQIRLIAIHVVADVSLSRKPGNMSGGTEHMIMTSARR